MTSLKLYGIGDVDFNVCLGKLDREAMSANYVAGLSLGGLVALREIKNIKGKIILINPPVPKRNIIRWFVQWVKFITSEGLLLEVQKFTINPALYIFGLIDCIKLFNIDFSKALDNVSTDKVTVIRGRNDMFFCDELAVDFLRSKNIKFIEVEGGHNWNVEIEKTLVHLL